VDDYRRARQHSRANSCGACRLEMSAQPHINAFPKAPAAVPFEIAASHFGRGRAESPHRFSRDQASGKRSSSAEYSPGPIDTSAGLTVGSHPGWGDHLASSPSHRVVGDPRGRRFGAERKLQPAPRQAGGRTHARSIAPGTQRGLTDPLALLGALGAGADHAGTAMGSPPSAATIRVSGARRRNRGGPARRRQ
jgi:hypothetical protein